MLNDLYDSIAPRIIQRQYDKANGGAIRGRLSILYDTVCPFMSDSLYFFLYLFCLYSFSLYPFSFRRSPIIYIYTTSEAEIMEHFCNNPYFTCFCGFLPIMILYSSHLFKPLKHEIFFQFVHSRFIKQMKSQDLGKTVMRMTNEGNHHGRLQFAKQLRNVVTKSTVQRWQAIYRKTNKIYLEKPPDRPKNIRTKNAIR